MAEAVGLAVGLVGLAGLFNTCVECFKLVQIYNARSHEFELLQTMLDNQQFHFMAWGKACGFMDPDRPKSIFDDPTSELRNRRIAETMESIIALLTDGERLKRKYGLNAYRTPLGSKMIEKPPLSAFARAFQSTKNFYNTSLQRQTQITGALRWMIDDRDKFDKLIQYLRDLLSDLFQFTEDIGIREREQLIVEYELEMINDEPSLEAITSASAPNDDDDDLISGIASRKLSRIKAQSVATQSVKFDDSMSMASAARYAPSISTVIEEEMDGAVQEIGVMRVTLTQWRKIKTRAGLMPWLPILIVAMGSIDGSEDIEDGAQDSSAAEQSSSPRITRRIAINSSVLLALLSSVMGVKITRQRNVLIHPFKPLLMYRPHLTARLEGMQDKLMEKAKSPSPITNGYGDVEHLQDGVTSHGSPSKENERLERSVFELGCLLNFMDQDLKDLLQMTKDFKEKRIRNIAFENLWLLFLPGTSIIAPSTNGDHGGLDTDQAYQVLYTTGGRSMLDVHGNSTKNEPQEPVAVDQRLYSRANGYANLSSRARTDFVIDCFFIDYDGFSFGPRPHRVVIPEFVGERSVQQLPVFPLDRSPYPSGMKRKLLARGEMFLESVKVKRYHYRGRCLDEWDPGHRDTCRDCIKRRHHTELDTEVIIDHMICMETLATSGCSWKLSFGGGVIERPTTADAREIFESVDCSNPECRACTDVFDDTALDLKMRDDFVTFSKPLRDMRVDLDDEQMLLLPYRVCGYDVHARTWVPLHVSLLRTFVPTNWKISMDQLAIPHEHKALLLALIKGQSKTASTADYTVKNRGVLILLHGAAAGGKTLTAEVVANHLGRSLLLVRIPDLVGSTKEVFERDLMGFIRLAERWNCIILLREADIYLEQQRMPDALKNNMLPILRAAVDSFKGVMIFTSNKEGPFEGALKTRIQLTLYYPPLDWASANKIWAVKLRSLQESERSMTINEDGILKYARDSWTIHGTRWDGREIQNFISSAVALARDDTGNGEKHDGSGVGSCLDVDHFVKVTNASRSFDEHLRDDIIDENRLPAQLEPTPKSRFHRDDQAERSAHPGSSSQTTISELTASHSIASSLGYDSDSSDDLELQELELQLKITRLKRKKRHRQKIRDSHLSEQASTSAAASSRTEYVDSDG